MDTDSTTTAHLADYVRPLWSRKWLILVAVIVATAGVYAYYVREAKVYTSSALVFVKDPGDPVSGVPSLQSTDRSVSNQASLMYSREVAAAVAEKIRYKGTASDLLGRVRLASKQGEDFVNITARGRTATEAATIANGYAEQFVTLVNASQTTRLRNALRLSRLQLQQLPKGSANQGLRQAQQEQVYRLETALKVPPTYTRQIDKAGVPSSPASPKPVRNALFAFVLSLLIAAGVAFGLERFDRRLKRPEDIERIYGHPLLAILPHSDDTASVQQGAAALSPDFREAFRVLRTNIELARLDRPARTIVVSSAVPGEGKSTVVRNLALAFRETGKRVAVVGGDLRHPSLGGLFGQTGGAGLTDVLADNRPLTDVCVKVATELPGLDELARLSDSNGYANHDGNGGSASNGHRKPGSVTLLLSGRTPANPPTVLASERVAQLLDELRAHHDIVLIDSAPLLAVTDTVPLLRYADAAIFVGRLGFTTRDTAKRLAELLSRVPGAEVLGIVANDLSRFEAKGFGYGYGYNYGYGDAAEASGRSRAKQTV